ncbi:hypothetical protein JZ751_010534, partial [Albula glossodonta]
LTFPGGGGGVALRPAPHPYTHMHAHLPVYGPRAVLSGLRLRPAPPHKVNSRKRTFEIKPFDCLKCPG